MLDTPASPEKRRAGASPDADAGENALRQAREEARRHFRALYGAVADAAMALARWSNDQGVAYLYVYWDDDPRLLQPGNAATVPARFAAANLSGVTAVYDSAAYAAFILARRPTSPGNAARG